MAALVREPRTRERLPRMTGLFLGGLVLPASVAAVATFLLDPGGAISADASNLLGSQIVPGTAPERGDVAGFFETLIPANIFAALSAGRFVSIVVFCVSTGLALGMLERPGVEPTLLYGHCRGYLCSRGLGRSARGGRCMKSVSFKWGVAVLLFVLAVFATSLPSDARAPLFPDIESIRERGEVVVALVARDEPPFSSMPARQFPPSSWYARRGIGRLAGATSSRRVECSAVGGCGVAHRFFSSKQCAALA